MRITLIRPPAVTNAGLKGQNAVPPIGLAYIASSLRAAGHCVSAVDAVGEAPDQYLPISGVRAAVAHGLTPQEIAQRIDPATELIGISCMFSVEWPFNQQVIEAVRGRFPDVPIVLGGEHATACWRYILEACPPVTGCVLGEGEETIVDLADALSHGRTLDSVDGLAYREAGQPVQTAARRRIRHIDDIPEPDWSLIPVMTYVSHDLTWGVNRDTSMPILASRGCPYQCTFCSSPSMWTTYWTARSPAHVIAEMKKYIREYGARTFNFYDLTAIVKRAWIVEFAQALIQEDLGITWQLPSGTRSEAIDGEVAELLYRSGCRHLTYAPESGSAAVLKRVKKKIELPRMLQSMREVTRSGLRVKANIIFGFPDETRAEALRTLAFVARMAVAGVHDVGAFPYSPYPGTEIYRSLERSGRVRMDEAYFRSLLTFTDPAHHISFAEHFSSRQLALVTLGSMVLFYGLSFACRPRRLLDLITNVVTERPNTKLERQFLLTWRKHRTLAEQQAGARGPARRRRLRALWAVVRGYDPWAAAPTQAPPALPIGNSTAAPESSA